MTLELKLDEPSDGYTFQHEAMAANLSLWVSGVDRDYAKQAAFEFFQRVDEVESKLSLYQESSDVTRINLLRKGEVAKVSSDCVECLVQALEASHFSNSLFHPFLGAESLKVKGNVPPYLRKLVENGKKSIGSCIQLDPTNRLVMRVDSGSLLDLGGIGKGYALDVAWEELRDWEIPAMMANFGGSTLLFCGGSDAVKWSGRLGDEAFSISGDQALSSSGVGFQGEHIVRKETEGEAAPWLRSFVRCRSAGFADALSTAAILMSEEELTALQNREEGIRIAVSSASRSLGVRRFCEGSLL